MRKTGIVVSFILLVYGMSARAATPLYDLNVNFSVPGQGFSHSRLLLSAGETATITKLLGKKKTFVEVMANDEMKNGKAGILLSFTVGEMEKGGQKKILSTPRVFTEHNKMASFKIHETNNKLKQILRLSLSVVAKKRHL